MSLSSPPENAAGRNADAASLFWSRLWTRSAAVAVAFSFLAALVPATNAASPGASADIDQCKNGALGAAIDPCQWVNGNLNANQAHYFENESIAYRAVISNLVPGSAVHSITFGYDVRNGGRHALDYLTHFQRIGETVNPCAGVSPCSFGGNLAVPTPAGSPQPQGSFASLPSAERFFTIYGGSLIDAVYLTQGSLTATSSETTIMIRFTASSATTVLAWGGHISDQATWGAGNSAAGISGAPYHMRLKDLDGKGGNQDRSLGGASVVPAAPLGASLTVVKQVSNDLGGAAVPADFPIHVLDQAAIDVPGSPQPGSPLGTSYAALPAGTYQVTEDAVSGYSLSYSGDCASDGSILLANGDSKTCILTNSDQPSHLTVIKQFTNDDGGDATLDDVALFIDGEAVASGVAQVVQPGAHVVSESGPAGYSAFFAGDCNEAGQVTVGLGESKVCLITDDDIAPILTVTKVVVNDDNGSASAASFGLFVDGTAVGSGIPSALAAGSYVVSEAPASGYTGTISGDCASDGSITLAPGDVKSCTVTNDDIAPLLTVTKLVINDDGGPAQASEFPLFVDGASIASGVQGAYLAGGHQVSEAGSSGYAASVSGDCDADGSISLSVGDVKSCTITNDDIRPRMTVTKLVVNDDGGAAIVADALLFVDGQSVLSGLEQSYAVGSHQASEVAPAGYAGTFGGDCDADGNVLLAPGDVKSCTITNDDIQPRLTVTKVVINDHGGLAQASDFPLFIDERSVASGQEAGLDAGTHLVGETGQPGYAATISGDCASDGSITLAPGDVKSCTITNDDIQPLLTVTKLVINDHGGQAQVAQFPLFVDDSSVASGAQLGYVAGLHVVSETGSSGYMARFSGDCDDEGQVVLLPGDVKSCNITNDDIQPLLTVVKVVVNDNGGTAVIADALLFVDGQQVISGEQNGFDAGSYLVSESSPFGYAAALSGDCDAAGGIRLEPGDVSVCVFTNDDIQPLLTVTKFVINDNGGTAQVADFWLFVGDQIVLSGERNGFDAGLHQVSEWGPGGYAALLAGDCEESGAVSLAVGEVKACTITNDDIQPRLTVTKVVINDDGGSAAADSFTLAVGATSVLSGQALGFDAGSYQVSESGPSGYAASFSGDCASDGGISLSVGEVKQCIITNNDIAPILTITKVVINDNGGLAQVADFPLFVDGLPVLSGAQNAFFAGEHQASEQGLRGYGASFAGDCDANGNVSLRVGDVKTCTLTNDDIQPLLTVTKVVINDNGGEATVDDFALGVGGRGILSGEQQGFDAAVYAIGESGPAGYAASFAGDCASDGSISLSVGDVKQCTITNDDIQPRLTVTKVVINDNGGDALVGDFVLDVSGASVLSGLQQGFDADSYLVGESGPAGYAASLSGDCASDGGISLSVGDVKSCTITNDDIQPRLTVTKIVVNDDGGLAQVSDFALDVGGAPVTSAQEAGFDAAVYAIGESGPAGYAASFAGDCASDGNISLSVGEVKQCTITNDDIAPRLTVTKVVINDHGGRATVADFALAAGTEAMASGVPEAFDAGLYNLSESGPSGYAASFSGDCALDGSVDLALADDKVCILTNDDIAPRLRVVKVLILDDGGYATPASFDLHVEATDASPADFPAAADPGVLVTMDAGGYAVSEAPAWGFTTTYGADCFGELALDEERTCMVTNNDIPLGFMTGGGSVGKSTVRHGFVLHCNAALEPNRLEVNWGKGEKFHLEGLTLAACSDDAAIAPGEPYAIFDTYHGKGTGRYNGVSGATAEWTFKDAGEPGKKDLASLVIKSAAGATVLTVSATLTSGNHQAHT